MQAALRSVTQRFDHQHMSGRATGKSLVVSDFQQPETFARFHSDLSCRDFASNPHEAEPQNSLLTRDGRIVLVKLSAIRIV